MGSGALDHASKAGELAPTFSLHDADGNRFGVANLVRQGPVVLNFYPGDWCSHCLSDLNALASISPAVERLGARLLAIAPHASSAGPTGNARAKHPVPVLIDTSVKVTKAFGLAAPVASELRAQYDQVGCVSLVKDSDRWVLPIPGTYIIDRQGQIAYSFVAIDHHNRITHAEILTILQSLRERVGGSALPLTRSFPS